MEVPIDANNNGVLFLNSHIREKDVTDGTTHTIYVGEKYGSQQDLGWLSGTRATLRNAGTELGQTLFDDGPHRIATEPGQPAAETADPAEENEAGKEIQQPAKTEPDLLVGGFGAFHPYGVNFLFGDGAVRIIRNDIDLSLLQQLANRADGKLLEKGPTRGD